MSTAIVWFRRDLRLADQPALTAACDSHDRIVPLYIHAPGEEGAWAPGAASRWWLHHSLSALDSQLRQRHGRLHLAAGISLEVLRHVIAATGAVAVYWNRLYDPATIARDADIKQALGEQGVLAHSSNAALWCEPWRIATQQGEPYRVFTPYWRKLRQRLDDAVPLPVPQPLRCAEAGDSLPLDAFGLLPAVDWARGFSEWNPGEQGAGEMLELFADDAVHAYASARDVPARHGTSRMSPHLHFGELSPRQIVHRLRVESSRTDTRRRPDIEPYLRELGWREFAHHLLYHFPGTPGENFNGRFDRFPWAARDGHALARWQRGMTGIPLVDAGMRELWSTGWMHNRVRMVVASFLTKNLRQHWLEGARWFWDTLVDADLANNTMGWQWVAGSGADAAPYFRIFNPVTQSQRFDPEGAYIRRWVPELARAPGKLVHAPWESPEWLRASGYPQPWVDLKTSREDALVAYAGIRG
jgi:deoxyribodipyrimidine photo-lyase